VEKEDRGEPPALDDGDVDAGADLEDGMRALFVASQQRIVGDGGPHDGAGGVESREEGRAVVVVAIDALEAAYAVREVARDRDGRAIAQVLGIADAGRAQGLGER